MSWIAGNSVEPAHLILLCPLHSNETKNERKRQGITREQMEYLSEVSVDTIKRMEAGKPVSSEKLLRIVMTLMYRSLQLGPIAATGQDHDPAGN
ncbi:MAG: helix-turn-helix domain-containing protein [Oscillospiraceae bacterium]